jgi:hypothetical protein
VPVSVIKVVIISHSGLKPRLTITRSKLKVKITNKVFNTLVTAKYNS